MSNELPQDKFMLLSVVNTKLRDQYSDLDALCDYIGADRDEIIASPMTQRVLDWRLSR